VVNADGLVGRVLRVTRTTATVLLLVDAESVVGGRIGESMKMGFLHGRGDPRPRRPARPRARRRHRRARPRATWWSRGAARVARPYVTGVPVGRVTQVFSSLRQTSQRAVIEPFVDFGALDVVGVVVPSGTRRTGRSSRPTGRLR
jgi:rod shape-determining protein MreC